jgi:pyruvate/2-oxoglutarate dehydrogenase complex dihydrolipoamide dehydrogenase (E3) component
MPAVCFTEPELATVGYSEAQAKEEGLAIKASKFPYAANGRALSTNVINFSSLTINCFSSNFSFIASFVSKW